MSDLVSKVKWDGRRGSSARTLQVEFIDDDGYKHDRTGISIEDGTQCIFYWKSQELFRGMFMTQSFSQNKIMSLKAYDNGIYLANNKDTFCYENKTASEIFSDICRRFEIKTGAITDTSYVIPALNKPKTTAWDAITDSLSITYDATGIRFYPISKSGELSLIKRRENIQHWVIETGVNLQSYSVTKSIEKVKTRIKLLSKEGTVLAEASDTNLEKKIGIFQDVITSNDDMNAGQLVELVNTTLNENNKLIQSLNISALGQSEVITGMGVFVIIKHFNISKTYYIEEDSHTFEGRNHTMNLKLNEANDI